MRISTETRKTSNGKLSVRLVYYYGYTKTEDGKTIHNRKREKLDLFLWEKPKTGLQKDHNKQVNAQIELITAQKLMDAERQKHGLPPTSNLNESFSTYLEDMCREKAKSTSQSNGSVWQGFYKHLCSYVNDKDIKFKDIDKTFLEGFKKYLQATATTKTGKSLSTNTQVTYFNKMKACLNQAEFDRLIIDNPTKSVKGIKQAQEQRVYLDINEVRALVETECEIPILKKAFLFSCLTGLRWSDVQKLYWSDVEKYGDRNRIVFKHKKTKHLQYLDISNQAFQLLGERGKEDERVFKGLKYSSWNNSRLTQWVLMAGIKKHVTFHSSRHTFAVLQLNNGADIYTLSKLMGHSDIKTTQIYSDILDSKQKDAMTSLPDIGI